MFEHVGVDHYRAFFDACRDLLTPDGVMVLHSIGRFDGPGDTNPWIQKYIFPGGYIPALSEVLPAIEKVGLKIDRHRDPAAPLRRDAEGLARALPGAPRRGRRRSTTSASAGCGSSISPPRETSFRYQDMMNFQIQLTRHQDALPLTRNYMWEAEEALRAADRRAAGGSSLKIAGE